MIEGDGYDWWTSWLVQNGVRPHDHQRQPVAVGLVEVSEPPDLVIGLRVGGEAALLGDDAAATVLSYIRMAIQEKARVQQQRGGER
ncbi:hypothetical protein [Amycolatopsis suaedae]|uniref:Uncharacterized protein n=1 Tax=Amycolatopsis suaedae TaxID=2510978 RepID=A0A4Q7IY16_9PSEU|nr:hypothetical protein [Amycolatopsis suaedae]RZQ59851.1 hypothetical protein EWH70_32580 [Amycolatopsis suaedae]